MKMCFIYALSVYRNERIDYKFPLTRQRRWVILTLVIRVIKMYWLTTRQTSYVLGGLSRQRINRLIKEGVFRTKTVFRQGSQLTHYLIPATDVLEWAIYRPQYYDLLSVFDRMSEITKDRAWVLAQARRINHQKHLFRREK